jgi:hypothetical protein
MIEKKLHSWWIFHTKDDPGAEIGLVEAPDAESAIREAIRKYQVSEPEQQKRLVALRHDLKSRRSLLSAVTR